MALAGIRVVDLTRILAGPFCTMLLADMGADVIKIESPKGGDPVRGQGVIKDEVSWYFAQFNRNKKSLTLDLYQPEGKAVLADLLRRADVLVENYRPGVLAEMGFDEDRLNALNPALIVASINGFGSTGPYADRPSFDFIAQAMSGFMNANGDPDGQPMRSGLPISDLVSGLYAAFGVVSALVARGGPGSGLGQRVESSLNNGMISLLAYLSAFYFATGEVPPRTGNNHPTLHRTVVGHRHVGFVIGFPKLGNFVAPLGFGHAVEKRIFVRLGMRITANQTVFDFHTSSPWIASRRSLFT